MFEKLHFLILADDPLARAALAASLNALSDVQVVGQMGSTLISTAVIHDQIAHHIDMIIWDLGWETAVDDLPDSNELGIPIIFLLTDIDQAVNAWASGGRAILLRELAPERIYAAALAVLEGLIVITPEIASKMLVTESAFAKEDDYDSLTPRELEVLCHLAEGLTNKAIAQQLEISDHTVKFHVNAILNKLHAQSRTEAVVRATRQGLIAL
ncbi:MAG: response regulator transcription factor [Anaerolineales bacterium]|nr:response regulator transcription factor [Anaerolineales bacterium]